jgi:hypothetical protein
MNAGGDMTERERDIERRFMQVMARHDSLVRVALYQRARTEAEEAEMMALEAEMEALGEEAAAIHYGSAV